MIHHMQENVDVCPTYISTKHVVRVAHGDSIELDGYDSVHTVKGKKHFLFGPVDAEDKQVSQDEDRKCFLLMI